MRDEKISNSLKKLNKLRDIINDDNIVKVKCKNDMYGGVFDKKKTEDKKYKTASELSCCSYTCSGETTYKEDNIKSKINDFYESSEELSPLNISIIEEINENDKSIKGKSRERLKTKKIFSVSMKIAAASVIIALIYLIIISLYFKFSMRRLLTISNNYKLLNTTENVTLGSENNNSPNSLKEINDISKLKGLENLNLNLDIAQLRKKNDSAKEMLDNAESGSKALSNITSKSKDADSVKLNIIGNVDAEEHIDVNTKFLFRTKYQEDFRVVKSESWPNHSEINLSIGEISERYSEWNIVSFENNVLTFEKSVQGKAPDYYLIKALGGKIAVYYVAEDNELRLREVTSIETKGLEKQEMLALEEGIYVYGEELLIRKLETYSS